MAKLNHVWVVEMSIKDKNEWEPDPDAAAHSEIEAIRIMKSCRQSYPVFDYRIVKYVSTKP